MPVTIDPVEALKPLVKLAAEDLPMGVNATRLLKTAETIIGIIGSPTITPSDGPLVLTGLAPNSATFEDDSTPPVTVAIGKGFTVEVSGGAAPTAGEVAAGPPYTAPIVQIEGKVYRRYQIDFFFSTTVATKRGARIVLLIPY